MEESIDAQAWCSQCVKGVHTGCFQKLWILQQISDYADVRSAVIYSRRYREDGVFLHRNISVVGSTGSEMWYRNFTPEFNDICGCTDVVDSKFIKLESVLWASIHADAWYLLNDCPKLERGGGEENINKALLGVRKRDQEHLLAESLSFRKRDSTHR